MALPNMTTHKAVLALQGYLLRHQTAAEVMPAAFTLVVSGSFILSHFEGSCLTSPWFAGHIQLLLKLEVWELFITTVSTLLTTFPHSLPP